MKCQAILFEHMQSMTLLPRFEIPDGMQYWEQREYLKGPNSPIPQLLKPFRLAPGSQVVVQHTGPNADGLDLVYLTLLSREMPLRLPTARGMTEDQRQVYHLYSQGLKTLQIAERLYRSKRWVMYRMMEIKAHFHVPHASQIPPEETLYIYDNVELI